MAWQPPASCRLPLVGEALGARSSVRPASPTPYLDLQLEAGATVEWPALAPETAHCAPADGLVDDGFPRTAGEDERVAAPPWRG